MFGGLVRVSHPGILPHVAFGIVLGTGFDNTLMQPYKDVEDNFGLVLDGIKGKSGNTMVFAEPVIHVLSEQPDRRFMIRCDGYDIRVVLSSRYSPVDHDMLRQWVSETVGRDAQARSELTEEQTVLQLVNRREHGTVTDRPYTGLNIRNSEVGLSCVEVSGLVYRTICLNGLIRPGKGVRVAKRGQAPAFAKTAARA